MTLEEYKELAIKTIKWRGTEELDCDHMIIGMFSEIHEMMEALSGYHIDEILVKEELGDLSWYIVNYATIRKVSIVQQTDVGMYTIGNYTQLTSELSDIMKKWMIYNKDFTPELRKREEELVQKIINCICNFTYDKKTKVDINDAWDRNIAKLHKVRYKNATYSDEAANNRNLEGERKELEK